MLQVGLVVWVLLITYYLGRATRRLEQRPYPAFRCGDPRSRAQNPVLGYMLLVDPQTVRAVAG